MEPWTNDTFPVMVKVCSTPVMEYDTEYMRQITPDQALWLRMSRGQCTWAAVRFFLFNLLRLVVTALLKGQEKYHMILQYSL